MQDIFKWLQEAFDVRTEPDAAVWDDDETVRLECIGCGKLARAILSPNSVFMMCPGCGHVMTMCARGEA
jgi:rRNA maturation endonuclease Nob1